MEQSWLNDWPFFVFPNTYSETFAVHLLLARYHPDDNFFKNERKMFSS